MKTADWNRFIAALQLWLADNAPQIVVPAEATVELDGAPYPLGARCQEVLAAARAGELTPRQIGTLSSLGQRKSFHDLLDRLDEWTAEHGTAHVPQAQVVTAPDGSTYKLGRQANQMRDRYARGTLSVPQIVALEQRPGWSWGIWYQRADRVADYLARNGSLDGLHNHDRVLYAWLQRQLRADLKPDQARRLAELTTDHDARSHLEVFVDNVQAWLKEDDQRTVADLKVNVSYTAPDGDTVLLGKQAANYRSRYNTGKLAPQDAELIIARLPGWVWTRA